jgi:hypothetical protein
MGALLALALLVAGPPPDGPNPRSPPKETEKPAEKIDLRIAEAGQLAELQVDGATLIVRSTAGSSSSSRRLSDDERARISDAARKVIRADEYRRTCVDHEVFITVSADGKTLYTALCDSTPESWGAAWRHLVKVARALAQENP